MTDTANQVTIIFGAGPSGLTAAWELSKTNHECLVLESDPIFVGGIARTANIRAIDSILVGIGFLQNQQKLNIYGMRFLTLMTGF
jgi:protoporphyrinogen oxidase